MSINDENYTGAKKAYHNLSASELYELDMSVAFDMLPLRQRELFMNFFELAQKEWEKAHDRWMRKKK